MSRLLDYHQEADSYYTFDQAYGKIDECDRYKEVRGMMDDLLIELYHPQDELNLLFVDDLLRKMAIEMELYIPNYMPAIKREPRRI